MLIKVDQQKFEKFFEDYQGIAIAHFTPTSADIIKYTDGLNNTLGARSIDEPPRFYLDDAAYDALYNKPQGKKSSDGVQDYNFYD